VVGEKHDADNDRNPGQLERLAVQSPGPQCDAGSSWFARSPTRSISRRRQALHWSDNLENARI